MLDIIPATYQNSGIPSDYLSNECSFRWEGGLGISLPSWLGQIIHHASTLNPLTNKLLLPLGLGVVAYVSMDCLFAYLARYHAKSSLILAAKWNSTTATVERGNRSATA